ncbi:hypothetical protein [Acetivibrio ethanolgignens]|uniref:Uncharacterized protein n=1 Tax=Acetivibrio ethanolgignens TaxID=290052 RepID=A0A0V8QIY9_9FIRM|nr:hypothetical protein [Acetivibrio ethanolgignens]KSV60519.1 hypothetical protein ASU35_04915 [Acetivibrio ethanolgignens]
MIGWSFPSRNNGDIEGFSNPALEWFKGSPLRALAREVCQNSLDAQYEEDEPVRIEFKKEFVSISSFPGMTGLQNILLKCKSFWPEEGNEKTHTFINTALRDLREGKICLLRVSDFNTKGLEGPYSSHGITPWVSLVKGTAFSVKSSGKTAAGSYGIGKAAPFINSKYQTVFYRTKNIAGETAVQGIAHLMSFSDESYGDVDPIRRSVGYFGETNGNIAVPHMAELDRLYARSEVGTDLFVPGFNFVVDGKNDWVNQMIGEILENFLMAIEYKNLVVSIEGQEITRDTVRYAIARNQKYAKDAYYFNKILMAEPDKIVDEDYNFHGMGQLRLRLLYANDLNKKILVVRKSGMKISEIKGLPKGISYTGILELQGERLNAFFREMENPTHDKWEPNRHSNPSLAKMYKTEVEDWVKSVIRQKVEEMSGAEVLIDTGNLFNTAGKNEPPRSDDSDAPKKENVIDTTKNVEVVINPKKTTSVRGAGGTGSRKVSGTIDDVGNLSGHRHRDGECPQKPTGRKGREDQGGQDSVFSGMTYINVSARVISVGGGVNRLICIPEKNLSYGEVQVLATGENGKSMPIRINNIVNGTNQASIKDGKIVLKGISQGEKVVVDFQVSGRQNYAMGVEVSGNQE